MDDLLRQLIELQKEQNQLLRKYLWRLRFSLMTLLLLTTATAIGLGFVAYQTRPPVITPTYIAPPRNVMPAPAGDINIDPAVRSTGLHVPPGTVTQHV